VAQRIRERLRLRHSSRAEVFEVNLSPNVLSVLPSRIHPGFCDSTFGDYTRPDSQVGYETLWMLILSTVSNVAGSGVALGMWACRTQRTVCLGVFGSRGPLYSHLQYIFPMI
jgi:hypothetical protein